VPRGDYLRFSCASTALERHDKWQDSSIDRGPRSLDPKDPIRNFDGNIVRAAVLREEAGFNAG
jgi:hypothetical protein